MRQPKLVRSLAFAVLFGIASVATAQALKLSHVRPQGTVADVDVRALADALAKTSSLKVEVFPANALGDYTVTVVEADSGQNPATLRSPMKLVTLARFRIAEIKTQGVFDHLTHRGALISGFAFELAKNLIANFQCCSHARKHIQSYINMQ